MILHTGPRAKAMLLASMLAALHVPPSGIAEAGPPEPEPYRFETRDAILLLGGVAATAVGKFVIHPSLQDVPAEGLDPGEISWGWDRDALALPRTSSLTTSDILMVSSALTPSLVYLAQGPGDVNGHVAGRLWTTQAEALLVSTGLVEIVKHVASRPRPFTYLPESERGDGPKFDVTQDRAFESFPSGHAASSWASALSGASYLAFARPDWSGGTHFASGVLAGGIATATGVLRVDSQQHFPTDVVVGSAVGAAIGVGLAALNKGPDPGAGSRGHALRNCLFGAAAGAVLAILVTPPASPFFD